MTSELELIEEPTNNWKATLLIIGGVAGAVLGLGTAYFMIRTAEEHQNGPPEIHTGDALKIGFNLIGLIRGIAALAGPK